MNHMLSEGLKQDSITMRELRRDNERLIDAIDDIVTAWELPGAHCELIDAITAARELIEDMGPEAPRE